MLTRNLVFFHSKIFKHVLDPISASVFRSH